MRLRMTGFGGFALVHSSFHLWNEVIFFALFKYLFFFRTMSKRENLESFQRETDEIIDKGKRKN